MRVDEFSRLHPSCTKPILYPNAHLQLVGQEVAELDIEACKQLAEADGRAAVPGKEAERLLGQVGAC